MNRPFNILPYLALICLSLAVLSGCKKVDVPSDDLSQGLVPSGTPITFETEDPASKAIINSKEDLEQVGNSFRVFSWFEGTTSGSMFGTYGTPVTYTAETSTSTPAWTYDPPRYWMSGTYNFAAVYPSSVLKTSADDNTVAATAGYAPSGNNPLSLNITNFDVTKHQDDLLVAINDPINGSNPPTKVGLNFKHTLACVQIKLKLNRDDFFDNEMQVGFAYVELIGFQNIAIAGSMVANDESGNINLSWTPTSIGALSPADFERVEVENNSKDIFNGYGLLVIPQSFTNDDAQLYMRVRVEYPNITSTIINTFTVPLNIGFPAWEPGIRYVYEAEVTQDLLIGFSLIKVEQWSEEQLGDGFIVN